MFSVPVSVRSIVRVAYAVVSIAVSKSSVVKSADVTVPSLFPRVVVNEVVEVCVFVLNDSVMVPLNLAVSIRHCVKVIVISVAVVIEMYIMLVVFVVTLISVQLYVASNSGARFKLCAFLISATLFLGAFIAVARA